MPNTAERQVSALPEAYYPMPVFIATDEVARKVEIAQEIKALNHRVSKLMPGKKFSDLYLELIAKAQEASSARQWDAAHNIIWNVTFLVNRAIKTKSRQNRNIILALLPPFLTFLLLFFFERLTSWLFAHNIISLVLSTEFFPYLWTGAIGGTTIAYWGLVKHTIDMDFDDTYSLWYWFKPLLGAIFGLITVVVIRAGLVSIQGQQAGTLGQGVPNTLPLYLIAFLAGFSERFFVKLIDRVATALFGGEVPAAQPPAPAISARPPKAAAAGVPLSIPITERVDERETEHPGLP